MLALRVTDFEHAVGCLCNSACSLSVSLVYREVQTRQKQLAVNRGSADSGAGSDA